jgi:hypothetical protein
VQFNRIHLKLQPNNREAKMRKRCVHLLILTAILLASVPPRMQSARSAETNTIFLPYIAADLPLIFSQTLGGNTRVWGNVFNSGKRPVYDVFVQVDFLDVDGTSMDLDICPTVFKATLPGQYNPFECVTGVDRDLSNKNYAVQVISYTWDSPLTYLPLTVISNDIVGGEVQVVFRNDHPVTLYHAHSLAWSLHQDYHPADESWLNPLDDQISPGEAVTDTSYIIGLMDHVFAVGLGQTTP